MAVIFAVGGAAVIGVIAYDNHSDWHEYSDWGEYSDAAERKKRRIEALRQETEAAARDLADYKKASVNPNLTSQTLKRTPAMTVSTEALNKDARQTIDRKVERETDSAVQTEKDALKEIDSLLKRIEEIEKEEGRG